MKFTIWGATSHLSFVLPVLRRSSRKSGWAGRRRKAGSRPPSRTWAPRAPTSRRPCCTLCSGWSPAPGTRASRTASTSSPSPSLRIRSRWSAKGNWVCITLISFLFDAPLRKFYKSLSKVCHRDGRAILEREHGSKTKGNPLPSRRQAMRRNHSKNRILNIGNRLHARLPARSLASHSPSDSLGCRWEGSLA